MFMILNYKFLYNKILEVLTTKKKKKIPNELGYELENNPSYGLDAWSYYNNYI